MSSFDLFISYSVIGVFVLNFIGMLCLSLWENFNKKHKITKVRKKSKICGKESIRKIKTAHNNGIRDIKISEEVA